MEIAWSSESRQGVFFVAVILEGRSASLSLLKKLMIMFPKPFTRFSMIHTFGTKGIQWLRQGFSLDKLFFGKFFCRVLSRAILVCTGQQYIRHQFCRSRHPPMKLVRCVHAVVTGSGDRQRLEAFPHAGRCVSLSYCLCSSYGQVFDEIVE